MKYAAIAALLFSVWWFNVWRHDPVEGVYMRAFAILVGIGGILIYLEGLKREIIAALEATQTKS